MVNKKSSTDPFDGSVAGRRRSEACAELQELDAAELTTLFLDTVDAKILSVMTASLKVARERGERNEAFAIAAWRRNSTPNS